jgi:MFS family permease
MSDKKIETKNQAIIILLSLIGFFGIFSTTMSKNPVLSLFTKSLNSTEAIIGLIAAVSPLAGIFFSFPVGFFADKIGKKKLLIISSLVFLTAPLLYLTVNNALFLIPIRFFHGIATAILGPIAAAIICDAYPDTKGTKLGLYSSATLIGRTLAPILGGTLITYFVFLNEGSWNFKIVYTAAFLISIPILIFSLLVRSDSDMSGSVKKISLHDFLDSLKTFLTEKKLLGTSIVEMATYFTFGAFETYLPLLLSGRNVPVYLIGVIFSIQVISIWITKPFFGKLSDTIDRRIQIVAGIIIIGLSIAAFPFFTNIFIIIAISIVFGIGQSLSTVATTTYVADVAKKENLGTSLGALSSIMDIGHSSGPFITGIIISLFTYSLFDKYIAGFMACAAVCFISMLIFIIFNFNLSKK